MNLSLKNPYIKMTRPTAEMKREFPYLKTGYVGDIAVPNYGGQLGPIARMVISTLPVALPCNTIPSSVKVYVDGLRVHTNSFSVYGNKVFVFPPGGLTAGNHLDIKYKCQTQSVRSLNI